jgi:antitoxin YefM
MKIFSFNEANHNLARVLDHATCSNECAVIANQSGKDVVVMSHARFNSLLKTLYLLRSPANSAHLQKSIAQYRSG